MANKTREHANFRSGNNLYVDIANNRVGVGTTIPSTTLQVSGTITCIDINSTSDINLKENIHPIDDALNNVMKIDGVKFRWKNSKELSIGVIAQNIEDVVPELVKNNNHIKTLNYNGLIGLLIEAIKEQQVQINTLKMEIEKLNK